MNDQLALCGAETWSILGLGCSISGLFQFFPLPEVTCPVLDIRDCDPTLVFAICHRHHPSPELDVDVDGLIPALLNIGARPISHANKAMDCPMIKPPDPAGTLTWAAPCSFGENLLTHQRRQL